MINQTRIVNVNDERCDIYIGRGTKYGNPFKIGRDGTREEVIEKYEEYIRSNEALMKDIINLNGLSLGCYCKPLPCHGDIIIKIIMEQLNEE